MNLDWHKHHRRYVAAAGPLCLTVKQKPLERGGRWCVREVFGRKYLVEGDFAEPVLAMQRAERLAARMLRAAARALTGKPRRKGKK